VSFTAPLRAELSTLRLQKIAAFLES